MSAPLQGTASAQNAIKRVHYTHDAMIDLMVSQPQLDQNELAAYFGYSVGWTSRVINSDAFQARLAERKVDLVDPTIKQNFEDRLKGLANQSLDILTRKLDATQSADLAIKSLQLSTTALGMGARQQNVAPTQMTFVVALPPKSLDQQEWAEGARKATMPQPLPVVQDVTAKETQNG